MEISKLFDFAIERNASDLHLVPGYLPSIRVNNDLYQINSTETLTGENIKTLIFSIISDEQKDNILANKEMDFGYEYKTVRFRCNVYFARENLSASFRLIPSKIKSIEELNLPAQLHQFAKWNQGLILITGPTGEGKSTTLAAIIDEINHQASKHIITIEDPIEYIYQPARSIVSQRELHQDTHSWTVALRSVLREDPDIVLVGEMRDYETIQAVLTIAETGHLVFSTLHTPSSSETINRIIDVFPAHQQNQVRAQLASVLKAVIAERLIPSLDQTKRIPAVETLLNIASVSSLVREGKVHLIDNVIETEEAQGLMLFEKYLIGLYKKGLISQETALTYAIRPSEIKKLLTDI